MHDAPKSCQSQDSVDIFVQATAAIGMGHLSRVGALVPQLEALGMSCRIAIDADQQGQRFAQAHNFAIGGELRGEADTVIIDAMDVSAVTERTLRAYPTRILIAPNFSLADLATHVLVRDAPQDLIASLNLGAQLEVDPRFAFVTAHDVGLFAVDHSAIHVGLCLTGGRSTTAPAILDCLLAAPNVLQISAIVDFSFPKVNPHSSKLHHTRFTDNPWGFFKDINVFVGGDGVMIGEAVARALPTFSVTTRNRKVKNCALIKAGAIEAVIEEDFCCQQLQRRVTDRERLQELAEAARTYYLPGDRHALAAAIKRVCND